MTAGNVAISLITVALLAGCTPTPQQAALTEAQNIARATYRTERFEACMKALPAGPEATKYNDWDEVVTACDQVSYVQLKTRFPE